MATVREMVTKLGFETDKQAVKNYNNALKKMEQNTKKAGARMGGVMKGILASQVVTQGFRLMKQGLGSFITEASRIEDATAAFTPLLGGTEKAVELVELLNKEAASTPFQFKNISDAAKQLLPVMNQDINKTKETFRMLGDTAGGSAQKLDTITRGFTKAMLKGKVDMESLNMISEAGVPIFDQLSKNMRVSSDELFKMVSAGKITTDQLTDTFRTMTSEGGIFFKGMDIASKTFSGKMSTLRDVLAQTAGAVGSELLPVLKPLIDDAIKFGGVIQVWIKNNQELLRGKFKQFFTEAIAFGKEMAPVLMDIAYLIKDIAGLIALLSPVIRVVVKIVVFIIRQVINEFNRMRETSMNSIRTIIAGFNMMVNAATYLWDVLKIGASIAIEFMKKIFFTFADYFLSVWGSIINGILSTAAKVGSALGLDVSAIDNIIGKVGALQKQVRSQSFIGDLTGQQSGLAGRQTQLAGGFTGGTTTASTVNVQSSISVQVPQGTPEAQQAILQDTARAVVRQEMNKAIRASSKTSQRSEG